MDALKTGLGIATVIAGPPLWSLVQSGDMSIETALGRAVLVTAGCALGVAGINRLIGGYESDQARARRIKQMLASLDDMVHEGEAVGPDAGQGTAQPKQPPPPTPPGPPTPGPPPSPGDTAAA